MAAWRLWAVLAALRAGWCLLPQAGYLHPDEFFQSPEVMAGDILNLQVYYPWEFHSSSPCRTVVFPLMTSGVTYWVVKSLQQLDCVSISSFLGSRSMESAGTSGWIVCHSGILHKNIYQHA
ncbi:GPI mannosyltransferase 4 [Mergus octosetaceus]